MPLKFTNDELRDSMVLLGPGKTAVVKGTIRDEATGEEHEAAVVFGPEGIEVRLDGYCDRSTEDGHGSPVYVEVHDREAKVHVWSDIEESDPTTISLEKAREDRRFAEGDLVTVSSETDAGYIEFFGVIATIDWHRQPPRYRVVEQTGGKSGWFESDRLMKVK